MLSTQDERFNKTLFTDAWAGPEALLHFEQGFTSDPPIWKAISGKSVQSIMHPCIMTFSEAQSTQCKPAGS